jgi:hypothetical protein
MRITPSYQGKQTIRITLGTSTPVTSNTIIPSGALVTKCVTRITTAYTVSSGVGATVQVGQTGSVGLFQGPGDVNATVIGTYASIIDVVTSSALALLVTIGGTLSAGAGFVYVEYFPVVPS